jgi:hypothetical protein
MKNKLFALIGVAALLATVTTGCLTVKTTETVSLVKQPDGTLTTNYVKVVNARNQDPLKDKTVRFTESTVGFQLTVSPGPTGVSGGLSPFSMIFGKRKMTWDTVPIYAGVAVGYTPPYAVSGSGAGSLWNDSDAESIGTLAGVLPTAAYIQATTPPVNPLVQTTGAVAAPPVAPAPVAGVVTNAIPVTTSNAIPVTTTNAPSLKW